MKKNMRTPSPRRAGVKMKVADILSKIIICVALIVKYIVLPAALFFLSDNWMLLVASIVFEIVYSIYEKSKEK